MKSPKTVKELAGDIPSKGKLRGQEQKSPKKVK